MTNLLSTWLPSMTPCLQFDFGLWVILVNPTLINIITLDKNFRSSAIYLRFAAHVSCRRSISCHRRKCDTHEEHILFIPNSLVKILRTDIRDMCSWSAMARIERWQSSSMTAVTLLMLIFVQTDFSLPPQGFNSLDSRPFSKSLYHCWIVTSGGTVSQQTSFTYVIVSFVKLKH